MTPTPRRPVRQITTAPDETSIVSAVIGMGQSLKVRVVAEGVETKEELAFLQAQQCHEAQGFYFGRPVPPQQFAKLLQGGIADKVVPRISGVLRSMPAGADVQNAERQRG